jgi:Berberine and berberine like
VPPAPPFPEQLHLQKMCGVVWCWSGPIQGADQALAPVRRAIPPALDGVTAMPYPALQSAFDPLYPAGLQWYWRADFVRQISDQAIDAHLEHAARLPTMHSTVHLYPIDGAVHRVGSDETAWSYRDATWAQVIVGVDPDPTNAEGLRHWTVDYWEALHPHSMGGAYVNFLMDEGQDRVRATYRDNYQRLAAVKRRYDPDNVFHVNQNIHPESKIPAQVASSPLRWHSEGAGCAQAAGSAGWMLTLWPKRSSWRTSRRTWASLDWRSRK